MPGPRALLPALLAILAIVAIVAVVAIAPPPALASPCLRPSPDCASHLVAEADLSIPLLDARADRRVQVGTSLGWMFTLRSPWAIGPIASIGYESESGASAGFGVRLRRARLLGNRSFIDLTAAARLIAADRSATRGGAGSVEVAYSWADWVGVGLRADLARIGDRVAPSLHATARLGSYLGLAVGGTSVLLVLVLQNVAFTS